MGKFEYEQMRFILENPSHRNKCIGLYEENIMKQNKWINYYNERILRKVTKHKIVKCHLKKSDSSQIFIIEETVGKRHSFGGSNFRIEMRGAYNALCTTDDFVNGTYKVVCPVLDACSRITIKWMFINFDAYVMDRLEAIDIVIYKFNWCPMHMEKTKPLGMCPSSKLGGLNGLWHFNQSWNWIENGCVVGNFKRDQMRKCMKRINAFHFIGDSHLRFIAYYFTYVLRGYLPNPNKPRHQSSREGNIFMWWSTYSNIVADNLIKLSKTKQVKANDVVVISTGSWGVYDRGLESFMKNFKTTLLPSLRNVTEDQNWPKPKLIFLNAHPYPENRDFVRYAGYRNNFAIAAANYWIRLKMLELDVRVIDAFSTVIFRSNENMCGGVHYICFLRNKKSKNMEPYGTVGYKVVDIILSNICD